MEFIGGMQAGTMLKRLFGAHAMGAGRCPRTWDDDPVARKTGWTPHNPGGASFRTHHLVSPGGGRMEFRMTTGARAFCWLFMVVGAAVPLAAIAAEVGSPEAGPMRLAIMLLVGATFFAAGLLLLRAMDRPRVFDKTSGLYWKGRAEPGPAASRDRPGRGGAVDRLALDDVHALQLLCEHVSGNRSSYHSYELNLVLADGRRINVTDHGRLEALRDEAHTLSRFLDVPVWDATRDLV